MSLNIQNKIEEIRNQTQQYGNTRGKVADVLTQINKEKIDHDNIEEVVREVVATVQTSNGWYAIWEEPEVILSDGSIATVRKVIDYKGGVGSIPDFLAVNIGKYYAKDGGFTTNVNLATDYKGTKGLDGNGTTISTWTAQSYTGLTQVIQNNKVWELPINQSASATDVPGISNKWIEKVGESVLEKVPNNTVVKNDNYTGNSYFINANEFSGFGFDFGVQKDFNQAIIKVGQIVGTSKPVTEVNMRICENTYTGNVLAPIITIPVTIAEGEIQDIEFNFPNIPNATGQNIWVEFWCNGKTGLFKGNLPSVNYRYKTSTMPYSPTSGMDVQSTASSGPNLPFYLLLNNVGEISEIKDDLLADTVSITDDRPVRSSAVAAVTQGYDQVITDGFDIESQTILGNENINVQNSTFKGWGQLKGALTDFNRIGYIVRPFDASDIPTKVKCILRKQSSTGEIIFNQTKDVSLELNVNKKVYFDLPSDFVNANNDEIFVSFLSDGMMALIGGLNTTDFDNAHAVKYTTSDTGDTLPSTVTNLRYVMYTEVLKGDIVKKISEEETERIAKLIGGFDDPDFVLPSRTWLYPGFEYNIFNENVCVPKFGDNDSNYRTNFDGSVGKQTARGFRVIAPESLNTSITLSLLKGRNVLAAKTQLLLSSTASNGTGVNRNVLIIGDSTVNNSNISTPLKAVFDADPMDITLIGTLGAAGVKHEGRGGWRISDYYGQGRVLYKINLSGVVTQPGIGAVYSQGSNTYKVEENNITEGYISVSIVTGTAPTATGTLTKVSGAGDNTLTYTDMSQTSANPFYYASTGKFDLGYYLTSTSQSLTDGDLIFFQLGINDVFSFTDLTAASTKVNEMIAQLTEMISNIHTYNSNIRVGVIVTFPPADQNAFGESYTTQYMSEMYRKTGLVTWQKKLIETFDNSTSLNNRIYLISTHCNLDRRNNYPTITRPVNSRNSTTEIVQSNGVHPAASGYAQIADMYAGLIKFFG